MRGGSLAISAFVACLAACSSADPAIDPGHKPKSQPSSAGNSAAPEPDPHYRLLRVDPPPLAEDPQGGGIKGTRSPGAASLEVPYREPGFDDVLRMQKEVVARNGASDDEKLRLALLHATAGNLEEAERVLSTVRTRANKLIPYVDLFLRRQLGDHKEASKLLALLDDEEKLSTGFVIERAQLCSRIRRFRDYVPAESDKVTPGGVALLYVEPRNFTLQRNQDKYILHLKYEWKLFDDRSTEQPVPAWEKAPVEEREDRLSTNGPVCEFFQSFKLPLPSNLAMGHYRISVTVTDAHSGKSDRAYGPLYVTAVERAR